MILSNFFVFFKADGQFKVTASDDILCVEAMEDDDQNKELTTQSNKIALTLNLSDKLSRRQNLPIPKSRPYPKVVLK